MTTTTVGYCIQECLPSFPPHQNLKQRFFFSPVLHGLREVVDALPLKQPRDHEFPLVSHLRRANGGRKLCSHIAVNSRRSLDAPGLQGVSHDRRAADVKSKRQRYVYRLNLSCRVSVWRKKKQKQPKKRDTCRPLHVPSLSYTTPAQHPSPPYLKPVTPPPPHRMAQDAPPPPRDDSLRPVARPSRSLPFSTPAPRKAPRDYSERTSARKSVVRHNRTNHKSFSGGDATVNRRGGGGGGGLGTGERGKVRDISYFSATRGPEQPRLCVGV